MAQTIKIKRSGSASATPSSLEHGELAINYADGKIYYKNSSNNIVEFTTSASGSFLPLSGGTLTGNLTSGTITVNPQNSTNEGGEIILKGAGSNEQINIDNHSGLFRIFDPSNPQVRFSINTSGNASFAGSITSSGSVTASDEFRGEVVAYANNQDAPYMIAGTSGYTGATTNWNTFGFQHRIKTSSTGIPRVTIDTHSGEAFSIDNNHSAVFSGSLKRGNMTIDSSEIDVSSGDLTLDVAGKINLDAGGGNIDLKEGGTTFGRLQEMIGGLGISAGSTPTIAQLISSTKTLFF